MNNFDNENDLENITEVEEEILDAQLSDEDVSESTDAPDISEIDALREKSHKDKSRIKNFYVERSRNTEYINKLSEENEYLKTMLNTVEKNNDSLFDNYLDNNLQSLKQREGEALDRDSWQQVQDEMFTAKIERYNFDTNQKNKNDAHLNHNNYQQDKESQSNNRAAEENRRVANLNHWLRNNPELDENSQSYNEKLAQQMDAVAGDLYGHLKNSNTTSNFLDDQYLTDLHNEFVYLKSRTQDSGYTKSNVSGGKNNLNTSSNMKKTFKLTQAEIDDGAKWGHSKQDLEQYHASLKETL